MNHLGQILNIYREWAQEIIGFDIEISWCTDFGCYPQDPDCYLIEIGMLATEFDFSDLPEFLLNNFDCNFMLNDIQFYTLCFLHEIGHLQTWDYLTLDEQKKEKVSDPHKYRRLPTEYAADGWAVTYIDENLQQVLKYWQPQLEKAYEEVTQKDLENFIKTLDIPLAL